MKYLPKIVLALCVLGIITSLSVQNYLAAIWAFTASINALNICQRDGVY